MGLIETALEHVSIKVVAGFIVFAIGARYIVADIVDGIKLRRLGKLGLSRRSWVPFGLDFVYNGIKAVREHRNLELWRQSIFLNETRYTVDSSILAQRIVFTAEPENVKAILATQFSEFGKGEQFHNEWKDFLGDSIFTTDGDLWHGSRQLIRPQFSRDRVSDLECFESHIQTLFKVIANGGALNGADQPVDLAQANGKVVDISEMLFRYTLDVATEFLLGTDVQSMSMVKQEFAEAFNEVQRVQNIIARTAKLGPFIPKPTFWAGMKVINTFINRFIEKALRLSPEELEKTSKSEKGYNFLYSLAGYTREPKVLRDQIIAVLLAGRDTTACTLSWALYELARHPEAVAKLRREILDTVGPDRAPTYADLKNMSYLKNVINETLRLYPAVPFNVRVTLKDTTLPLGGGPDGTDPLPVLAGTPVGYSTLVMQRRADLYPPVSEKFLHTDIFSPERWEVWHPKSFEYVPFNAGPRICIGQQFALTEMGYTLCRLFQRFETIENHMGNIDGGNPMLKAEIVLSPGQGVKVAFREPPVVQ